MSNRGGNLILSLSAWYGIGSSMFCYWCQALSQKSVPIDCAVCPQYSQFRIEYSMEAVGTTAYILKESQYNTFVQKEKTDSSYVPAAGEYMESYVGVNNDLQKSVFRGTFAAPARNDYGTVRLLVKLNPEYTGKDMRMEINATLTPYNRWLQQPKN